MMEQKTTQEKHDRAKYKLAASIKECMKTTPVDRITVKDIVEGSGLTRQTFYRNFKDKYDLINWYFDKLVLQSFEQIGMGNTVGESLTQKFEFILNEKAFFTEAFRSDDYNSVKEHDFELILQFYKDLIARKTSRPLEEEMEFLLEMYCRGSVYMTEKMGAWRNEGFAAPHVGQAGGGHAAETGEGIFRAGAFIKRRDFLKIRGKNKSTGNRTGKRNQKYDTKFTIKIVGNPQR